MISIGNKSWVSRSDAYLLRRARAWLSGSSPWRHVDQHGGGGGSIVWGGSLIIRWVFVVLTGTVWVLLFAVFGGIMVFLEVLLAGFMVFLEVSTELLEGVMVFLEVGVLLEW